MGRERIELKNQADALAFQAEQTLTELGDKVDAGTKSQIEGQISALREAITSEDETRIRSGMDALQQALYALSQQAYSAGDGQEGGPDGRKQDEGVVEGEYTVD
jgi:molecular chaperone DnaK